MNEEETKQLGYAMTAVIEASQPKWISADDELPEENDYYLCYTQRSVLGITEILQMIDGKWHDLFYNDESFCTHWMPLPEPPKK